MELALYCPVYGYYEAEEDKIPGQKGDFYTSVSVGPMFGKLLGFQFANWLETGTLGGHGPEKGKSESGVVQLMEAGAHDGTLARDILTWLRQHRPALFERLEYVLCEPSVRLRERQRRILGGFPQVRWVEHPAAAGSIRGIIFSNELLDAMPVHRYQWDAGRQQWFEWGVAFGEGFEWTRLEGRPASRWAAELGEQVPDGFVVEESLAASQWWTQAASVLRAGKLVTFDYGLVAEERLERRAGTLRAYRRHAVTAELLQQPGTCDLTAHVDFTAIRDAGEAEGLQTEFFGRQEQFMTRTASILWAQGGSLDSWTPQERRQFQTLTHPEHLGRFRVLVQGRV